MLPLHYFLRRSPDKSHLARKISRLLWPGEDVLEEVAPADQPLEFGLDLLLLDEYVLRHDNFLPETTRCKRLLVFRAMHRYNLCLASLNVDANFASSQGLLALFIPPLERET